MTGRPAASPASPSFDHASVGAGRSIGLVMALGKRGRRDLDDQKAAMFQLIFHLRGLGPVGDDNDTGFVGSLRMSVEDRQAHRESFSCAVGGDPDAPGRPIAARFGMYLDGKICG
jgi:hypothetical protein